MISNIAKSNDDALMYQFIENIQHVAILLSTDWSIIHLNPIAEKLFSNEVTKHKNNNFLSLCQQLGCSTSLTDTLQNNTVTHSQDSFLFPFFYGKQNFSGQVITLSSGLLLFFAVEKTDYIQEQQNRFSYHDQLKEIIRILPGHVYWKDKDGVYLGSNDTHAQNSGYKSAEYLIGKTDYDTSWHKQATELRKNDCMIMKSGKACSMQETATLATGEQLIFLSHKIPLKDDNGKCIGILGMSYPIFDEKQQKELIEQIRTEMLGNQKKSHIYLKNIISNIPAHVWWVDRDGYFLGCNDHHAHSLGLKEASELIGKHISFMGQQLNWDKRIFEALRENDLNVIETGTTRSVEEEVTWADGIPRVYLSHKTPLRDEKNQIIGMLGIAIDITKQKELQKELSIAKEKAEAASIAKTQFMANISHDIRTPLVGIQGIARLLSQQVEEEYKPETESIVNAGSHLLNLLNEVISLAKFETGEIKQQKIVFDLKALFDEVQILQG